MGITAPSGLCNKARREVSDAVVISTKEPDVEDEVTLMYTNTAVVSIS